MSTKDQFLKHFMLKENYQQQSCKFVDKKAILTPSKQNAPVHQNISIKINNGVGSIKETKF